MKNLILILAVLSMFACTSDPNSPGVEYMPDMYYSQAYTTYSEASIFKDSATALLPPQNSIARGQLDFAYPFENSNEGYEAAGNTLKNPIELNDINLAEGKEIYGKFCVHCHGDKGDGNGKVPTNSDYPNPPAYNGAALINLPEGKMYHTITYGKNLMGSHASQLNPTERWKVIHYVTFLQNPENPKFAGKDAASNTEDNLSAQL